MRFLSLAIAMAALFLTGGSARGVAINTRPAAGAFAVRSTWRQWCQVTSSGVTVQGYVQWVGLADSIDWGNARACDIAGRPVAGSVVLVGQPYAVR